MEDAEKALGISCLSGSKFYVCKDNPDRFMGCCSVDACAAKDGRCPDDKVTATRFKADAYKLIPGQSCFSSDSSVSWYTCAFTNPPFMGCCSEAACVSGCPAGKVEAARLSSDDDDAAVFLGGDESLSTSSTSGLSVASTSTDASKTASTSTSTPTSTSTGDTDNHEQDGLSKGAIAGIVVASIMAVLFVLGLILLCRRRKAKKSRDETERSMRARYESHTQALRNYRDSIWEPSPASNVPTQATPPAQHHLERGTGTWERTPPSDASMQAAASEQLHRSPAEAWEPAPDYYSLGDVVVPTGGLGEGDRDQTGPAHPLEAGRDVVQSVSSQQTPRQTIQQTQSGQPRPPTIQNPPNWQNIQSIVELPREAPSNRHRVATTYPAEKSIASSAQGAGRDGQVSGLVIPPKESPVLPAELEDSSPPFRRAGR